MEVSFVTGSCMNDCIACTHSQPPASPARTARRRGAEPTPCSSVNRRPPLHLLGGHPRPPRQAGDVVAAPSQLGGAGRLGGALDLDQLQSEHEHAVRLDVRPALLPAVRQLGGDVQLPRRRWRKRGRVTSQEQACACCVRERSDMWRACKVGARVCRPVLRATCRPRA